MPTDAASYYSTLSPGRKAALHSAFQFSYAPNTTKKDYLLAPELFQDFLRTPAALDILTNKTGFQPGVTPNQAPLAVQTPAQAAQGRALARASEDRAARLFQAETAPGLLAQGAFLGPEGLAPLFSPSPAPATPPAASQGPLTASPGPVPAANPLPGFGGLSFTPRALNPARAAGSPRGLDFAGRLNRVFGPNVAGRSHYGRT